MALSLVTPPAADSEAVTLEEAKKQARLEGIDDDDDYLEDVSIPAAIERCELATQRQVLEATYDLKLDGFPACGEIEIPRPPLVSVTYVRYVDVNGITQTLAVSTYVVDAPAGPRCKRGTVSLAYGQVWPSTRAQKNAVTIRFVCGYGTEPAEVPAMLRQAILRDVATLYEHREDLVASSGVNVAIELPGGSKHVYRRFKSVSRLGPGEGE